MKVDPKIELISIMDNRKTAWIHSRPGFDHGDIDIEEIGSMDMSLNSLCQLTFKITSSVIFRDFLFSIRPISAWARSSRSAPLTIKNCLLSSEFNHGEEEIRKTIDLIDGGAPQDLARENLPMTVSTSYIVSFDFRTVCSLIKTMELIDKSGLYEVYGKMLKKEMEGIKGFKTNKMGFINDHYTVDENMEYGLFKKDSIIIGKYKMKYSLASQFLRQSNSSVNTGIWNSISSKGYFSLSDKIQKDSVSVSLVSNHHSYKKLIKLRSHWFADWSNDMWGKIVGDYIKEMTPKEFFDFIPNGNGKEDPYYRDMISRVVGEEHNLPCPIMLEYPELIDQRISEQGENPVVKKYKTLSDEGLIKNNNKNELRIKYINMVNRRIK